MTNTFEMYKRLRALNRRAATLLHKTKMHSSGAYIDDIEKQKKKIENLSIEVSYCFEVNRQLYLSLKQQDEKRGLQNEFDALVDSSLNKAIHRGQRAITEATRNINYFCQEFFIQSAILRLKDNDPNAAIDELAKILATNPANHESRELLKKIIRINKDQNTSDTRKAAKRAQLCLRKYRFEYTESFSLPQIHRPFSILVLNNDQSFWISDSQANQVYKFTTQNQKLLQAKVDLKTPLGLIYEYAQRFWICDYNNRRLVAMNHKGEETATLAIQDLISGTQCINPGFGCFLHGRLFLVLVNGKTEKRCLIEIDPESPNQSKMIIPEQEGRRITSLCHWGGKIYFTDYFEPSLFVCDIKNRVIKRCQGNWDGAALKAMAAGSDSIFCASQDAVLRYDPKSEQIVFAAGLDELTGLPECTLTGMYLSCINEEEKLFVLSDQPSGLHCFTTNKIS